MKIKKINAQLKKVCKDKFEAFDVAVAMQYFMQRDGLDYTFTNQWKKGHVGMFMIHSANAIDVDIQSNGDVLLSWTSPVLYSKKLRAHLTACVLDNGFPIDQKKYRMTVESAAVRHGYVVQMEKKLFHNDPSLDIDAEDAYAYAGQVMFEMICFMADANGVSKYIEEVSWKTAAEVAGGDDE